MSIAGDSLDAELFRSYLEAWDYPGAFGFSARRLGNGCWRALGITGDVRQRQTIQSTEFRAFAGNFLFSTVSNQYANRFTAAHFDLPMRGCTISLDDEVIVEAGVLRGELA